MTYAVLNVVVLGALVIAAAPRLRRLRRAPLLWTALAMVALTAVFDNAIIATGIVTYGPDTILGLMVGIAPIEDFAYTVAAVLLMPAVWVTLRDRARAAPRSGDER